MTASWQVAPITSAKSARAFETVNSPLNQIQIDQQDITTDGRYSLFTSFLVEPERPPTEDNYKVILSERGTANERVLFASITNKPLHAALASDGSRAVIMTGFATPTSVDNYGVITHTSDALLNIDLEKASTNVMERGTSIAVQPVSISRDGKRVAYVVNRPAPWPIDGVITVWDASLATNFYPVISPLSQLPPSQSPQSLPVLSPNGEWVAYRSQANLATGAVSGAWEYYITHIDTKTNHLINASLPLNGEGMFRFSPDNRFVAVAYQTNANYSAYKLDVLNLHTFQRTTIDFPAFDFSISGGGHIAAISYPIGGTVGFRPRPGTNVLAFIDIPTGTVAPIANALTNGQVFHPQISYDGQYVVFSGNPLNRTGNSLTEIYLYEAVSGTTMLISAPVDGKPSDGSSSGSILGPDGRTVIFRSFNSQLLAGDRNLNSDYFYIKLGAGDSDDDGLEDDWEIAYFNDLSHDGNTDTDSDGATDMAEHRAGTNPINDNSILRTVTAHSGGPIVVYWPAVPGKRYIVEGKSDLAMDWTAVSSVITAQSWTGQFAVTSNAIGSGFYRLKIVE